MATIREMLEKAGTIANAEKWARQFSQENKDFLLDLQLVLNLQGKFEEAAKVGDELFAFDPHNPRVLFNRGWHLLRQGTLSEGIGLMDEGRKVSVWGSPSLKTDKPIWRGENLVGKRIVLRLEGGLGDEIIGVRFAKNFHDMGAHVIVVAQPKLHSLLARAPGVHRIISEQEVGQVSFDYWLPAMSAPRSLGLSYEQLGGASYLSADPAYVAKWASRFPNDALKVGLRWSGNPQFEHEQFRRFPPQSLFALAEVPGVQCYSLQRDSDLQPLPRSIVDLGPELETWEDTAGVIAHLDLVITSCTSVAHLSAAMGKETWIIVPILPYYVWAVAGERSPWYDSVRLFRQKTFGNWATPLESVRQALQEKLQRPESRSLSPITMTVSSNSNYTLHFMAGLPRTGSTVLTTLLSQNPDIHGAPLSGLCSVMGGIYSNWDKMDTHRELPNDAAKQTTLRAVLDAYHAHASKQCVIDKNRQWISYIPLLEAILGRKIKMIVMVRPVVEILTSFELLIRKNPLSFTLADQELGLELGQLPTMAARCQYFMGAGGPVGLPGGAIKDVLTQGFVDRLLFVDYNNLTANPEKELKRIYAFLGMPPFQHDLANIHGATPKTDLHLYPGLHVVRPKLEKTSPSPVEILGPELVQMYSGQEFWEPWI